MVHCNLIKSWPGWFCGAALTSISLPSAAALIDENFNDVTGLSGAGSTRSIQNILSGNPSQLPPGTLWSAADARDVNVRRADNPVNTSTGSQGFNSFFSPADSGNKFLVLGDRNGQINGPPTDGLFAFAVPFTVPAGATHINVSFDWAFDGVDTNNDAQDRFVAGVLGDGFNINNPLAIVSPLVDQTSPSFAAGHVNATLAVGSLPTPIQSLGTRYLVFGLSESLASNNPNSAAGIDNITVSAVPLPAAVWLFGSALMGMGLIGRRKAVAQGKAHCSARGEGGMSTTWHSSSRRFQEIIPDTGRGQGWKMDRTSGWMPLFATPAARRGRKAHGSRVFYPRWPGRLLKVMRRTAALDLCTARAPRTSLLPEVFNSQRTVTRKP